MEIRYDERNFGRSIIVTADNVKIEEDVEEREYAKKEDGKTDFSRIVIRDIKDEYMHMIANLMQDMAYYRERPYDSSGLIKHLFEKLPNEVADSLVRELHIKNNTINYEPNNRRLSS